MSDNRQSSNKPRTFLINLVFPTPNGRLHLGHIGGPYLKLDVIKRYNLQIGNKAVIYGGTDSYETYVLLQALKENKSPEQICEYYHQRIIQDLNKMNISLDEFINPIHETELFYKVSQNLHEKITPFTTCEQEFYPCSLDNEYIPPSFFTGNCPNCNEKIHSLICESCGLYFKPEHIKNLQSKTSLEICNLKQINSLFLPLQKDTLKQQIIEKTKSNTLVDLSVTLISQIDSSRLSLPINWGITINDTKQVFYTYGNFFHYLYVLGEKYKLNESSKNPFDSIRNESEQPIETIVSFGFDNIVSFMIYTINYSLAIQSPGVTHHLPNYFLTLDGDKFSTSRKHAIWVEDLSDEISIDILRLYLLKINVDESPNDFNTNDFINFYNSTSSRLTQILGAQEYSLNSGLSAEEIEKLFQITRSELYTITMPENYSATRIYNTLSSFLGCNPLNAEAHANWLKFFAILFYPVMPELTQHVWQTQGFEGFPVYSMSPNPPKSFNAINIIFPVISQAHLN